MRLSRHILVPFVVIFATCIGLEGGAAAARVFTPSDDDLGVIPVVEKGQVCVCVCVCVCGACFTCVVKLPSAVHDFLGESVQARAPLPVAWRLI